MKKFKNLISEIQQPLSQGEKNFKDMHGDLPAAIEKAKKLVPGITDQPNVFNGIEKTNSIRTGIDKNISDYDKGLKVNEATLNGIDPKDLVNKYRKNEENNDHSENVKLLAKHFGTEADYKKAERIHKEHMKIGHLPKDLGKQRDALHKKLRDRAERYFNMVKKETNEALNRNVYDVMDNQKMIDKGYVRNYSSVLPSWKKKTPNTPTTPTTPAKKETNEEADQIDELKHSGPVLNNYLSKTNPDRNTPEENKKRAAGRGLALGKKWGKALGINEPKVSATNEEIDLEEANLEKIDTPTLQALTQLHTHYGQKDPRAKASAERGRAELKRREDNLNATKKTFPNVTHTTKSGHPDWEKHGIKDMPTVKETKLVSEARAGTQVNALSTARKFQDSQAPARISAMLAAEKARLAAEKAKKASQDLDVPPKDHKQAYSDMRDKMGMNDKATTRNIIGEKTLTPAEIEKREEIAKSMERDNPGMPMDKKMAIATAAAKRVAEGKDTFAKDNKERLSKKYRNKNQETENERTAEVKTMVTHDCAKHIAHEEWGFGTCIPGEHTIVETSQGEGYVTHYDIMFEHGIEYDVPAEDIKVIMSETHGHAPRKTMQEEAEMDYEGEMARSELNAICDKSRKLADMMSDDMQLEAWLQSKITKAKYMIDSVYDYLMYSDKQSGMKSPMPSADASSYAQTPAMAANYSSFLNKMAEEKILSAKQKHKIDVNDNNKIDRNDFEILRSSKKGSDTEETTAHRKKIISKTVEEAVDDEEKADKQSGASLNPITRLNAAHQLLRGKIGIKHPIKFDDGKHELDINTVRKALDLHGNAKTAAEKEKIQNAFKTHAGLLKALEGEFAAEKKPISLGGTKRVGGIKPIKEYADPVTGRMDPFTGRGDFQLILTRGPDGKPFFRKAPTGEIGIGKKTAAIKDTSVSEETMLNNLYHTLSEDNKSTFMEKLRTEDGLTELLQFAQEQGL